MGTLSKCLPTKNRRGLVTRPSGIPRTALLGRDEVLALVSLTRQGNRQQRRQATARLRRYNVCFEARYKAVRGASEVTVTPDELVGTIIPTERELNGQEADAVLDGTESNLVRDTTGGDQPPDGVQHVEHDDEVRGE